MEGKDGIQQEIAIVHISPQTINWSKAIQELSLTVPLQDCEKGETLFVPSYLEKMQKFRMIPENNPQLTTTTPSAFHITQQLVLSLKSATGYEQM